MNTSLDPLKMGVKQTFFCSSRKVAIISLSLLSFFTCFDNNTQAKSKTSNKEYIEENQPVHNGRNGKLTAKEKSIARNAWRYFETNYQAETGLVNAVNNYPSTTMWDTASYLGGLVSAYELKLIDKTDFDKRLVTLFKTFNKMDLFRNEMPNKVYNTKTGQKVNYANKPGEIGYSAIDLGRLLIWFKIIKERYPEHSNEIDYCVMRWNFCNTLDKDGTMYGALVGKDNKVSYNQEGRLGYEEYAAKGFQLWGFNTEKASKPEPYDFVPIYGINIPYDTRDPRYFVAHNYVVTESYILDGLELNWDLTTDHSTDGNYHSDKFISQHAEDIYKVQEQRYKITGILTARSEHQLDQAPYFVYDSIFTDGYPWNTITDEGKYVPQYSAICLKAAMGMWVLWDTDYTNTLFDRISDLYDPNSGYYEGVYENGNGVINTFTANNNGIMLEALLYKVQGKILQFSDKGNIWDVFTSDQFQPRKDKCFPNKTK